VEESVGMLLAGELRERGVKVVVHDLAGMANARRVLGDGVVFANSPQACVEASDVVVVTTPWREFALLPREAWGRNSPPRVVIDCWRVLKGLEGCDGIVYVPLGKGEVKRD
jgi:UDPglucose 6-dehydrogenase